MKKILHLLLISILIYFLFFQTVKEGLNENKCDKILEKKECNNEEKHPECHMFENEDGTSKCMNIREKNIDCKSKHSNHCSIDENCGHLITGNDAKSTCVLNYYHKKNNKHIPFYNRKKYKNDDNYISLDRGKVYKHGILGLGEYITNDIYMAGNISNSDHNPHLPPKFKIELTKNLIKETHKDEEKANVRYNLKDAINKTFPMYEQDGKDNFTVKLHKIRPNNVKYPKIVMKFDVNNSILEINNLPNHMLKERSIYSAYFYVKKGKHLDCEGPNQPEHCKYKKLDTGCKTGEILKSFPEEQENALKNALKKCSETRLCFGINKLNGFWNLINPLNNTDTRKFYIGGSGTHIKKVSFPGINLDEYNIPQNNVAGDNPQNPGWGDKFQITQVGHNILSVKRTDSPRGWGQQLYFNLHKPESKECYEKLNYKEPVLTNVKIKDFHKKFISGQSNGTIGLRNSAHSWETFTLEKQGDKTFAIRSVHKTYLTRRGYNDYLWNSKTIDEKEKFNIIKKNNFYIIKQKGTLIASSPSRNQNAIFKDRNSEWGSYYHFSIIHSNQNKLDKFLAN